MLCLVAACTSPTDQPPIVGTRPIECDPPPGPGSGELDVRPGAATSIRLPLVLFDPDCKPTPAFTLQTTQQLAWRDRATDHLESVTATQRTAWTRVGNDCRVDLAIDVAGGPVGRTGMIQPCTAVILSDDWASFAAIPVPVTVTSLSIDGAATMLDGVLAWRQEPAPGGCTQPKIERQPLAVAIAAQLTIPLDGWRRLHATKPTIAIGATIEVY
jgi:hypothetical protein